jgi:group I intron endonuclease
MTYGHIYKITNTINHKVYYGQTRQPPNRRWSQHKQAAKKGNKMILYDAMRKHGIEHFTFEVICECETLEELNKKECEYILEKNTLTPNGYNASKGGDNYEKTAETCKKISESNKGRIITPEWRENMAKARRGKKISEETREKMKQSQKGRVITEEAKEKLRQHNLGKKQSPETLEKKRLARMGVPWSEKKRESMVGKTRTEEQKKKMSEAQKGRVFSEETKQKMSEAKQKVRKLTDEQIQEIQENKENLPQTKLAEKYNVSKQLISVLIRKASVQFYGIPSV